MAAVFSVRYSTSATAQEKVKLQARHKAPASPAEIDNVIGGSDVSLRNLKMQLETRGGNLTSLDVKGKLDGGALLLAKVDQSSGERRLLVDSSDAGQVLKLVGFYPNMQGGRLRLEVDLDGTGPAEKTGTLWVENFKVLGDPIVSEVVSSADQGRPAIGGGRNVTREIFEFDKMRAPFSVGYGQFVLEESYVKGPLLGANLRGKVDFKTKRINIGGTYIPLQGLNGALGGIPVLGQIISGAQGEGIFGMTFAVQGATSNPQVIVNPLSLVAPGIFREMFQMTATNPRVQVRDNRAPQMPVEDRVRSSSSRRRTPGPRSQRRSRRGRPRPRHGRRLVVDNDAVSRTRSSKRIQTGFKSTCFFLPSDSLMTPLAAGIAGFENGFVAGNGLVVDFQTAALDLSSRLAVRGDEARLHERGQNTESRRQGRRD